ncbi:pre-mycofactocin synthase MftD [Microbacterium sp. AGC85]
MARTPLFISIAEAQRLAKKRLPAAIYEGLYAAKESGVAAIDNVAAFQEIKFKPRVADIPARDLSLTIMGQPSSMPIMIAPAGAQAVHPEGEVAAARASKRAGIPIGLSNYGSRSIEDVAAANDNTFLQLYWTGTREDMLARAERGRAAGSKGIILSVDYVHNYRTDWRKALIPDRMGIKEIFKYGPQALLKPRYVARWLPHGIVPQLRVPNVTLRPSDPAPFFNDGFKLWTQTPPPTWADLEWFCQQWDQPVMIKGITHVDDAKRSIDIGAAAISVSNHGGNNFAPTLASIRCLPEIADAVGTQIEVLMDGGVRRGSDVVKALALGAKAVLIGRAYLYPLAADGERGVETALEILRAGISESLYAIAKATPADVERSDVYLPNGFAFSNGPDQTPFDGKTRRPGV